jgi:hypothetical protein
MIGAGGRHGDRAGRKEDARPLGFEPVPAATIMPFETSPHQKLLIPSGSARGSTLEGGHISAK